MIQFGDSSLLRAVEFALEKDYDHVFHKNAASSRELDSTSTFLILSR